MRRTNATVTAAATNLGDAATNLCAAAKFE